MGLMNYHRDITPPLGDIPEIGWSLLPTFHGKGYATEAAQAILAWATHAPLSATRFACIIHPENTASLRVAAKCGFIPHATSTYRGEPSTILFADLKS